MKISPAQEYEQNNLSPMVEYYNDPDVDYCDDCNAPQVWCVCISTYIEKHIYEQHDYSYANDERDYDICLYCDCRRYVGSDDWVVA